METFSCNVYNMNERSILDSYEAWRIFERSAIYSAKVGKTVAEWKQAGN